MPRKGYWRKSNAKKDPAMDTVEQETSKKSKLNPDDGLSIDLRVAGTFHQGNYRFSED